LGQRIVQRVGVHEHFLDGGVFNHRLHERLEAPFVEVAHRRCFGGCFAQLGEGIVTDARIFNLGIVRNAFVGQTCKPPIMPPEAAPTADLE